MTMNTIFHKLIARLQLISMELPQIVESSIDQADLDYIAQLNVKQLQNSQNIEGQPLGIYADNTVNRYNDFRETKVSIGEDVKLKDTGELYDSIYAEVDKDVIILKADYNDDVLGKLEGVYGEFIGLTEENKELVSTKILPDFRFELTKRLLE